MAFISELIPDIVEVCRILKSVSISSITNQNALLLSFRSLLKMSEYFDKTDVLGNRQLANLCRDLIIDTELPDVLTQHTLQALKCARENINEGNLIDFLLSQLNTLCDTNQTNISKRDLYMFRFLQILSWALQQLIGSGTPPDDEIKMFESYMPLLLEYLQKPDPALRGICLSCLGLLPLYFETFASHYDILFQAASADFEDEYIRTKALQSIVDIATVYGDKFKDDVTISNLLMRLINQSTGMLRRVAVEGASKLLFSGCLTESKLFAHVVKFFFLPQLSEDDSDSNYNEQYLTAAGSFISTKEIGSQARLHQALSVFFHFFLVEGYGREQTILNCIPELVSDVGLLIRDGSIEINSLQKVFLFH
jgi:hypothetical protein